MLNYSKLYLRLALTSGEEMTAWMSMFKLACTATPRLQLRIVMVPCRDIPVSCASAYATHEPTLILGLSANKVVSRRACGQNARRGERSSVNSIYQEPNEFSDWERQLVKKYKKNAAYLDALKTSIVNRHMADRTKCQDLWRDISSKTIFTRYVYSLKVVMSVLMLGNPAVQFTV